MLPFSDTWPSLELPCQSVAMCAVFYHCVISEMQSICVQVKRRVRARHPNLFDSDGVTVHGFSYLYWKSTLDDTSNTALPHCENGKNCNAKGCNTTQCNLSNLRNHFGFRYNDSVDGALWDALAADLHAGQAPALESIVRAIWVTDSLQFTFSILRSSICPIEISAGSIFGCYVVDVKFSLSMDTH